MKANVTLEANVVLVRIARRLSRKAREFKLWHRLRMREALAPRHPSEGARLWSC